MTDLLIDIGGTNMRIAQSSDADFAALATTPTSQVESVPAQIAEYAAANQLTHIKRILIGAAGPVIDGAVTLTNADLHISERDLRTAFAGSQVKILNDLAALAHCLIGAPSNSIELIHGSVAAADQRRVVVAPGTGLGVAVLLPHEGGYTVLDTEAGHMRAAPITIELAEVFSRLEQGEYLSVEDVASGPGLSRLFAALAPPSERVAQHVTPEQVVGDARRDGRGPAKAAIDVFYAVLASYCGDLALAYKATGGVYLAGSLVLGTRDLMDRVRFVNVFQNRGLMTPLVARIPIGIVLSNQSVLAGLRQYALMT